MIGAESDHPKPHIALLLTLANNKTRIATFTSTTSLTTIFFNPPPPRSHHYSPLWRQYNDLHFSPPLSLSSLLVYSLPTSNSPRCHFLLLRTSTSILKIAKWAEAMDIGLWRISSIGQFMEGSTSRRISLLRNSPTFSTHLLT